MTEPSVHRAPPRDEATLADIRRLAPWFHNLHLPSGIQTAPDHPFGDFPTFKWRILQRAIPDRLDGWTALDIGCNAGFYSIELARRGARVTAIDSDARYLRQARWAAMQFGVTDRIDFHEMQIYDLARTGESFDVVWFMGVFYHLRYPALALDIVAEKVRRMLIFQTLTMPGEEICDDIADTDDIEDRGMFLRPGWPMMAFIEHTYMGDPTNWWAPNRAAVEALLRSAGLRISARPGPEIYVCEPGPEGARHAAGDEFTAATGRVAQRQAGAA